MDYSSKSIPRVKSAAGRRSGRPALLKRNSSAASGGGSGDSTSRRALQQSVDNSVGEVMAASFLQYCAMCEKQITTPCNSILYCSEACRRKDANKPLSASIVSSTSMNAPPPPLPPSMPASPRKQVNRPTYSNTPFGRIPADLHDAKSDLDPTEWKPKLPHRAHSEAFRYLSQFHRSANNINDGEYVKAEYHPRLTHKSTVSTATTTTTTTPSLGNSPTTAASSFESVYDFNTRPLPTRHNPFYSAGAGGKGIDLVTPHIPPPFGMADSTPVESDDWTWEKRTVGTPVGREGLGSLFGSTK